MRINEKIKFLKEQLSDGIGNYQTTNELEELIEVTKDTTLDNKKRSDFSLLFIWIGTISF